MLLISSRQMRQIEENLRAEFFARLRSEVQVFMRQAAPEIAPAEIVARIDGAFADAPRHGILTQQQLTRYVYLLVAFPLDYAKHTGYSWLAAVLESPATADERLDCITAALTDGPPL